MNKYELAVVFSPLLDEESLKAELEKVETLVTRFNGTIEKVDSWGKRRLAYPIKKQNDGFYYFISFNADGSTPAEIESRIRIIENVYRYLIIRTDAK